MPVLEEDEDVILKGGPLHSYLVTSGFTDFEVYDKNMTNESVEYYEQKPNFVKKLLDHLYDSRVAQKYLPAFFEDLTCYDKFLSTLLNSSIVRAEAEYWLRNLRNSVRVQKIKSLSPVESYSVWQSPFSFLVSKPLLGFFVAQGAVVGFRKIVLQQHLITLQRLLASLETFNRKLGMAVQLTHQGEMSQRFLSSTFTELADSFLLKSAPNGVERLVELLRTESNSLRRSLDEMHLINPLPAEFDSRHALLSLEVPSCLSSDKKLCLKDLKEMQHYHKEVLTVFTHQLAMHLMAEVQQEGSCHLSKIFPVLRRLTSTTTDSSNQLKQIVDLLRGVNLLKAPPIEQKNGTGAHKRRSYNVHPLLPAIESSGLHLRNALSFVLASNDASDTEFGSVAKILQASRLEVAAADSFLHRAEILVNRLNKAKNASVKSHQQEVADGTNGDHQQTIHLDFSNTLSEIGDPFLEEVFQGTSFTHSLEWDDGEGGCGVGGELDDSAASAYYRHLMNELQSVLVSRGRSRMDATPETPPMLPEKKGIVTSTPFVQAGVPDAPTPPTPLPRHTGGPDETPPRPRARYVAEPIEQLTFVSPATLSESSLAAQVAKRAMQMEHIEETFEDETVFEDAED